MDGSNAVCEAGPEGCGCLGLPVDDMGLFETEGRIVETAGCCGQIALRLPFVCGKQGGDLSKVTLWCGSHAGTVAAFARQQAGASVCLWISVRLGGLWVDDAPQKTAKR